MIHSQIKGIRFFDSKFGPTTAHKETDVIAYFRDVDLYFRGEHEKSAFDS